MRTLLRRLLDEDWIVILASGIALGYTALNLAQAIGSTVEAAIEKQPLGDSTFAPASRTLTIRLDDHVIAFSAIVSNGIAFLIVLVAVIFVVTCLRPPNDEGDTAA
ncbi:MAG: hypothetical protein M3P41_06985 [Actinomycetota bacterium]|nr:hypothetical protein [Actinomycetota bacterium]